MKKSLFLLFILVACKQENKPTYTNDKPSKEKIIEFNTSFNAGKTIFTNHCSACHQRPDTHRTDAYIFDKLFERLPEGESYFINYISDSKSIKQAGDPYALKLDHDYPTDFEHHFKDTLTDKNFEDLILYIKAGAMMTK